MWLTAYASNHSNDHSSSIKLGVGLVVLWGIFFHLWETTHVVTFWGEPVLQGYIAHVH